MEKGNIPLIANTEELLSGLRFVRRLARRRLARDVLDHSIALAEALRDALRPSPEVQYSFTVTTDLKPGHAAKVDAFGGPASLAKTEVIFPQHIIINVPCPGFLEITSIRINDIECLAQEVDGFAFAASGVSPVLDLPSLTSLSRVRVLGRYTGLCPPPLVAAGKRAKPLHVLGSYMPKGHYAPWKLTVTFQGPLRRGKL